ncbi:MAG: lipid-A-disaccharide synthase [Gammaproteobacteria bacterium]|nr:lipid-A-disaccharide synthase [Gammaproteobacteria bacterium]
MQNLTKRILISAGEPSGDMHAANLVKAVIKNNSNVKFYGMGGSFMHKAGVDLIVNSSDLTVIGALEIITKFKKIWRAFNSMKHAIRHDKPDLLLLVDYPGFNLRLAKIAKKSGVKVLYYISPKVWAWHESRVKIIKRCVDMMAVIFPFEVDFYKKWQIPVKFVGNPLSKMVKNRLPLEVARQQFKLDPKYKTIGLFPGSRLSEIKRLLPVMLETAKILKDNNHDVQFLLSQASSISSEVLQPYLQSTPVKIQVITNQNYDVMQVCDAIIAASGTATLEITLIEVPLVIIYKMAWWEAELTKRLIKIPYIGLCNILAGRKIVAELLQDEAIPGKIAAEVEKMLYDLPYRNEMISNLKEIKNSLELNDKEGISDVVMKMLR